MRDLCSGLTLPELEGLRGGDARPRHPGPRAAVRRCGGARVLGRGSSDGEPAPHPFLICIYRFVQEGLMNAFRHAPGAPVRSSAPGMEGRLDDHRADEGPGFDSRDAHAQTGWACPGLRERVESIGGELRDRQRPDGGTRLTMTCARSAPR